MRKPTKRQREFARGDTFFRPRPVALIEDPFRKRRIELLDRFFAQNPKAEIRDALNYVARILQAESEANHACV